MSKILKFAFTSTIIVTLIYLYFHSIPFVEVRCNLLPPLKEVPIDAQSIGINIDFSKAGFSHKKLLAGKYDIKIYGPLGKYGIDFKDIEYIKFSKKSETYTVGSLVISYPVAGKSFLNKVGRIKSSCWKDLKKVISQSKEGAAVKMIEE